MSVDSWMLFPPKGVARAGFSAFAAREEPTWGVGPSPGGSAAPRFNGVLSFRDSNHLPDQASTGGDIARRADVPVGPMPITLNDDARAEAIASIQMYSEENFDDRLGNLASGSLLDFFLDEIAPVVYNQAVREAQERLQARVLELDIDMREPEFDYSRKKGWKRGR